ncbi:MAG: divergent polysaccharide deacetylase family protein [Caulobacteraceae bacterium]
MFARRPTVPSPAQVHNGPDWLATLSNPYVGAGGAGLLVLLAAAVLIIVAGDPHAGAPSVRIALDAGAPTQHLMRPSLPLGAPGSVSLDNLAPGQQVAIPDAPIQGDAVITLPQGATVGAGMPIAGGGAGDATAFHSQNPPLSPAPAAGLTTPGPGGALPIIAKDGRTPFGVYARPFKDNGKPKVALIIGGLGLNAAATKSAIERLPPEVTLSFVPYAEGLQGWIDMARANGHEVMLELPMEPLDYPSNDPGPYTLMANGNPGETVKRLEWLLSRATGYFAVTNYLGGKFVSSNSAMATLSAQLKVRGLGMLDDGSAAGKGAGIPRASASAVIDEQLSADEIDHQLLGLEAKALAHGSALGSGFSYPVTVDQVAHWAQGVASRGYQLVPASAITRK